MSQPFASPTRLERTFTDGLAELLARHHGLGVYILVLANSAYDPALWARLSGALARRQAELAEALAEALRCGAPVSEPDDDLMVFLKLHLIGFDRLGRCERRQDGPWLVTFNPLRALRPPRASGQPFAGLRRPFDPSGFHFNRPFLAKEVFWEGRLGGRDVRMLYNRFPFARLHGLLVPEPTQGLPQHLTPDLHAWAWVVCAEAGIADLCIAFNSLGAGASVNHLHFQSFVQPPHLPALDTRFAHHGGAEAYPVPCRRFDDPATAWNHLETLHARNQPYNLVYVPGTLLCFERVPQDSTQLNDVCRMYGFSEMAGSLTVFDRQAFESWRGADFAAQLAQFAPARS